MKMNQNENLKERAKPNLWRIGTCPSHMLKFKYENDSYTMLSVISIYGTDSTVVRKYAYSNMVSLSSTTWFLNISEFSHGGLPNTT